MTAQARLSSTCDDHELRQVTAARTAGSDSTRDHVLTYRLAQRRASFDGGDVQPDEFNSSSWTCLFVGVCAADRTTARRPPCPPPTRRSSTATTQREDHR
ncbi:hypothetical protein [Streptomyces thioluteus]|uniref:hypothetical protein n=1 Tax=Streptomyces thioluteus TaxID=66431 RepID=UPI0031EF25E0